MNVLQNQTATPESVWAMFQEIGKKQAETDRIVKENATAMKETREQMKENAEAMKETREQMKETDQRMKETDRRMKELQKTVGGWANNHGTFAEEYFFSSFETGKQNFFGEHFDEIQKNVSSIWQGVKDEYDIVLYNHASVALIEVKYKAHVNDIPSVLTKAETFRVLFPNYKNFKIYLGLASLSFYPELEQRCVNEGIAIIKQVGDSVIINDKHLKVF